MSKQILIGVIISAHGTRGQVKIKPFSKDFKDFTEIVIWDKNNNSYNINCLSYDKNKNMVCAIENIKTRDEAEQLLKTELYITRDSLGDVLDGEFYVSDLIGLDIHTKNNMSIGVCTNVYNFGAGEILEYKAFDDKKHLVGFNDINISTIDLENKKIILKIQ